MSIIKKMLDEVKFRIPREILETVFINKSYRWRGAPKSIDDQILSMVIRPRVLLDCDIVGGTEVLLDMTGCPYDTDERLSRIYRVPKDLTQGRSITSVMDASFIDINRAMVSDIHGLTNSSSLLDAASGVLNSAGDIPILSTGDVRLIGENVILITNAGYYNYRLTLRVVVANEKDLGNIQPRSWLALSNLAVFAVKAYIYNNYIVELDMGRLHGGSEIGVFKDIIDGYADADELYRTELKEVTTKVLFMNDQETHQRFLRSMIRGY